MSYNSFIYLKGVPKALVTSKQNAEAVEKVFHDKNCSPDFPIKIGSQSFTKSQVKLVEINLDSSKGEKMNEERTAFYEEEKTNRANLVKQTPEYKAGLLDMFTYLYKFSTGDFPSEEKLSEARSIQHRFFIANPVRTLCDAHLLKTIIPIVRSKRINPYELGYFRLVENAVVRDMQLSK